MDAQAADVLGCCARGEISSAVALVRLLIVYGDLHRVRTALADLAHADGETDLQGAIDGIGDLLGRNPTGTALVMDMLRQERALDQLAGDTDEVERCRRLFDRLVSANPEASVALYSLGDPGLLAAATLEVVQLLERLDVLGPEREILEIGCGIGRFVRALAGKVAAITGVDIAPGMIETARRRCAGLANVALLQTCGRDLSPFPDTSFDTVLAIDAMPYVYRAGAALVAAHFAEVVRVLRPGGDFVILNLSYRGDLDQDREDTCRLGEVTGLGVLRAGTADLRLWDGTTFHLRKPETVAEGVSGDQPNRSSMRP
jgi:SAM-dependent methyltransferase